MKYDIFYDWGYGKIDPVGTFYDKKVSYEAYCREMYKHFEERGQFPQNLIMASVNPGGGVEYFRFQPHVWY